MAFFLCGRSPIAFMGRVANRQQSPIIDFVRLWPVVPLHGLQTPEKKRLLVHYRGRQRLFKLSIQSGSLVDVRLWDRLCGLKGH